MQLAGHPFLIVSVQSKTTFCPFPAAKGHDRMAAEETLMPQKLKHGSVQ